MIQVSIEGKKIRSGSNTPSFVARVHESHPASIKVGCKVNIDVVCIIPSKFTEPNKLLKGDLVPPSLGHPMDFSCVPLSSTYKVAKNRAMISLF
jgi:hypothetical protein